MSTPGGNKYKIVFMGLVAKISFYISSKRYDKQSCQQVSTKHFRNFMETPIIECWQSLKTLFIPTSILLSVNKQIGFPTEVVNTRVE